MNSLVWFLTDTDFKEEWAKRSFFGRVGLCYTTFGLLFFETLNVFIVIDLVGKLFS